MALNKIIFTLGVFLLIASIEGADKLKCYQCDGKSDGCKDLSTSNPVDCTESDKFCYKKKVADKWEQGCTDKDDICGSETDTDKCAKCDSNECNSAGSIVASLVLSSAALVFLKLNY